VLEDLICNKVEYNNIRIDIIYDNSKNMEAELENLNKEKEKLSMSIERREKLLSNENYVSKAPSNIVESERNNLQKEKEMLANVIAKLEMYK